MNTIDEMLMQTLAHACLLVMLVMLALIVVSFGSNVCSCYRAKKRAIQHGKILLFKIRSAHGELVDVKVDMAGNAHATFADGTTLDTDNWCISYPDGSVEHLDTYNYEYSYMMPDSDRFEVTAREKTPYEKGEVGVSFGMLLPVGD